MSLQFFYYSRASITIVRTGTVGGTTGPTIILLKGEKKNLIYTDEFLVKHGMAPGSTIIMTENAYMTDNAWIAVTKALMKGYREMPFAKENPHWNMFEFLDGFGSHERVLEAHQMRRDANVDSGKEESNTSHASQAYDQFVAKNDKKIQSETLSSLRRITTIDNKAGRIDQWSLVHAAIAIVKQATPSMWTASFQKVNLDPRTRIDFLPWCTKISAFLQAGSTMKPEKFEFSPAQKHNLLPAFWRAMAPAEREIAIAIVTKYNDEYTVDCLTELKTECLIPYADMSGLRVSVIIAKDHPEVVQFGVNATVATECPEMVKAASKEVDINEGLDCYRLNPTTKDGTQKLRGNELFDHMISLRNRKVKPEYAGNNWLDLAIGDRQFECISPSERDLRYGQIMKDATGEGVTKKIAKRKLNNLGFAHGHCCIVNSDENMKRMKQDLQLADSIAEIKRLETFNASQKKEELQESTRLKAPAAVKKFEESKRDASKLTKAEISALLFVCYGTIMDPKKSGSGFKKGDFVTKLKDALECDILKYTRYAEAEATKNNAQPENEIEEAAIGNIATL